MVKRKIVPIILSVTLLSVIFGNMIVSNATDNNLKTFEEEKTIKVNQIEDYKETLEKEISKDGITYKLEDIIEKENTKVVSKNKGVTKELIVNTNDKYKVLNMFEQELNIEDDGYTGTLKIDNSSVTIEPNDSYREEYKVYYEEEYKNVKSNELNNIPKTIKKDNATYYLVDPIWEVSQTQIIDGQVVPVLYNGTMKYEAIKERTVVTNYIATVKYNGKLKKEVVDTVTLTMEYTEVPTQKIEEKQETKNNVVAPTVATGTGILICSGIILMSRKNVSIYNYKNNTWKLVRKTNVKANEKLIDITPQDEDISRKYKIVLKNDLYTKWYGQNITVKYFDKQFICNVKENEIEIVV